MSFLHKDGLPIFIDENMLKEEIMRQATDYREERIMKMEGINFNEVAQLSLENKDITTIAYMWDFTSLEELYLDHNFIRKIEGLHHLFSLRCLSLSFNHIEKIEGLESLQKLEALDLSNNRISAIENMDSLEKLTKFCIGNNVIGQMNDVLYLRKFKNLEILKLSGNPVSEEENYKLLIVAQFPNLMYLDNVKIDEDIKQEAFMKYQSVHKEMSSVANHENDFVQFLNGCYPSGGMFKDDPEAGTLRDVTEIAQVMEKFEGQIAELFTQIITISLAEYNRREAEVNSFTSARTAAMKEYQEKASEMLQQNLQKMMVPLQESDSDPEKNISQPCNSLMEKETYVTLTEVMVELQQISDPDFWKEWISHCKNESSKLYRSLMEMELLHISQMEDITKMLDRNLTDMDCNLSKTAEGIFTQCRDVENEYYEKVRKVAVDTLEKVAKDEVELDVSEDVIVLFTDRDAVIHALDRGHANHLQKINDMETKLLAHVMAWKAMPTKGIQDKDLLWHRTRLADCRNYVAYLREEVEKLQL